MLRTGLLRRQGLIGVRVWAHPEMRDWVGPGAPAVWTGHQPWLWHPGILAKYLAADVLSQAPDAPPPVHLVVDHDAQDPLRLALPVRDGDALSIAALSLGPARPDVPPACLPPVDVDAVHKALCTVQGQSAANTRVLHDAFDRPPVARAENLGQQVAGVIDGLLQPWLQREAVTVFSSALCREAWFADEISRLLDDAQQAVRHYNAAVAAHPAAGVAPLRVEPDRVELPIWLLAWEQPRRRLFADLADAEPWLVTEDGQRVDPETAWLAPKALWMTALLRRRVEHCAGFIHGTGGGDYDRAMEAWWRAWRGEPLAPQAVVTADVTLNFDVPLNDRSDLDRAVWLKHHLPHNLDRIPSVAAAHPDLVAEKRDHLKHMDDDRDKARRRAAFDRVHTINAALADAHHVLLDRADTELRRTGVGVANAALANRRDWCFALYPELTMRELRDTVGRKIMGA